MRRLYGIAIVLVLIGAYGFWPKSSVSENPSQGGQCLPSGCGHEHEEGEAHADDSPATKSEGHEHAEGEHKEEHGDEHSEEGGHGHEEGHGEEASGSRTGPGKAILEAHRHKGLRLSEDALKTLEIKLAPIASSDIHSVPVSAIVYFKDEAGVYRYRDGWYRLIETKVLSRNSSSVRIESKEIKPGDQLVVQGVPLLRVAELEAWGGSGDGHGH